MVISRVGDIVVGICNWPDGPKPATGIIVSGSPSHLESGVPIARVADIVMWPCGTSVIVSGSPRHLEAGLPVARLGDSVVGIGIGNITSGSPRHLEV